MSFAWPYVLLLLLLPLASLVWELTHRRRAAAATRPKILRAEAGPRSLVLASTAAPISETTKPRVWLHLGLALAVLALARPQWGRIEEPVFDQSREILLAVDLSRSMLAPDVKPSRLDRAKLLIQSLLEKLAGERVGLVVFAGTAFLQSPLSADYEILREFLPALGPDFLPEGGSNYGALLHTSLEAFGSSGTADRFLIILSDGEATDEEWRSRLDELKKKNIRVIGLGVGTASGAMIPDGNGQFVKDERGAVVLSKLESATLHELARATEGVYRDASGWVDLAALVKETVEAGRKGQFVEKNTVRLVERFQWPLALGLWCLFVSFCYEFPVRPRPRDVKLTPTATRMPGLVSHPAASQPAAQTLSSVPSLLLFLGIALSLTLLPTRVEAAATLAPAPGATDAKAAAAAEPSPLAKIVGRLAQADSRSARDWAELARETVTWGSRLQSEQQPVAEGPVRDALAAVDLGQKLDAKLTDWPKLREELEALLQKQDQEQQPQDQQQQQNEDQQKQDNSQQKQDRQQPQQQKKSSDQKQDSKSEQNQQNQPSSAGQTPEEKKPSQEQSDSAFGDMSKKEEPPPPQENTQKVGGAPEQKAPEPIDPNLALPLQKLERLRDQDSPAQLFQLMEGDRKPTKKSGKDW